MDEKKEMDMNRYTIVISVDEYNDTIEMRNDLPVTISVDLFLFPIDLKKE